MRTRCAVLVLGGLSLAAFSASAQQRTGFARWSASEPAAESAAPAATVPDSVRRQLAYQHWKGAAIGGLAGAAVGTLLTFAARGACSDCTITTSDYVRNALLFGGGGAAFGLLVGAASPREVD